MHHLLPLLRALYVDRRAATAVEYGLILVLVVLASFAAFQQVANVTLALWNDLSTTVMSAV